MAREHALFPRPVSDYDLRLLRIFKVVVECGGFTPAESVLNITKSTISVHISNLETRLKVRLANRGRGGFALTEQGKAVYDAALELFAALAQFAQRVEGLNSEISGELTIVCSDQVALIRQLKLPDIIARLHQAAPKLRLAINADTITRIEQGLLKGDIHIGIIPDYRQLDGLTYRPCYSETFYLCIGRKHPLFHVPDADISDEQVLTNETVHPGINVNLPGIQQFKTMALRARAYQFDTRTPLVLSGLYQGFFPLSYIQGFLDRGEVRLLQPKQRCYQVDHVVVTRATALAERSIALFLDAFKEVQAS